jgi:hypothetical protein
VILDHGPGHLGEAPRQAPGVLVPPFLCEGRVPADVGDQERVDVRVSAGVRLGPGPLDGSPTEDDWSSGGITPRVWTPPTQRETMSLSLRNNILTKRASPRVSHASNGAQPDRNGGCPASGPKGTLFKLLWESANASPRL